MDLGDPLRLEINGTETDYTVCGIYSDITNGGKTAKISSRGTYWEAYRETNTPVIWSILYVSLKKSSDDEAWMKQYRTMGADVVQISDYVQDTYAQTLTQLRLASLAVIVIGMLVIGVVLGLFSRLLVKRNRYMVSLRKALGFTSGECAREYFVRAMIPAVMGTAAGLLLGCLWGEGLCALELKSFSASGFRFVIDPLQALAEIPLIALVTAALAIGAGITGMKRIKAYECCIGKE